MFATTLLLAAVAVSSPEGSLEVRGEGDVTASLAAVADVLVDAAHEQAWFDGISDARILRRVSDTEYILYAHIGTPLPLTDRELVVAVSVESDLEHHSLRMDMHSVDDPSAPRTGYVRAQAARSSFTLTTNADGSTHVSAVLRCDPRGEVPHWLVASTQQGWGRRTLDGLRRQLARHQAPLTTMFHARQEVEALARR